MLTYVIAFSELFKRLGRRHWTAAALLLLAGLDDCGKLLDQESVDEDTLLSGLGRVYKRSCPNGQLGDGFPCDLLG